MARISETRRGDFHQGIDRLFNEGTVSGLSDAQLLERFSARNDGAAFRALVERHGPMVLGVCRRFLRDSNDVDDAFQAVFLVLVRRAGDVRRKELLGNWLYGVACRVSIRARALSARRPAPITGAEPVAEPAEDQSWLHQEVERLPRRYRQPVVACYFEGRTHEEAASLLGCPLGTVKGRLSRARDLLRKRLERRGLTVPAVALAAELASSDLRAAVPVPLAHESVRSGLALAAAGGSLTTLSAISTSVRILTEGALHAMLVAQTKILAIPLIVVAGGLLTAGATVAARQAANGKPEAEPVAVAAVQPATADETRTEPSAAIHLTTFRRLTPAMIELGQLTNRFNLGLQGLTTDEDKRNALAVHRGRVEAMLRKLLDEQDVSEAGRDLKTAFAAYVRKSVEGLLSTRPVGVAAGLTEFPRLANYATSYERASAALASDLEALKSPEEREAALALYRARLALINKNIALEDFKEPFRDFADAVQTYIERVENDPESPEGLGEAAPAADAAEKPDAPAKDDEASTPQAGKVGGLGGEEEGGATDEPSDEQYRLWIARGSAVLARVDESPINQAVVEALDEPFTLRSTKDSTLGQMLKHIKDSARTGEGKKVPIYVDPVALEDAGEALDAKVVVDLEDVPLKFSLRVMLKQVGLAYCVRDGVVIISSLEGVQQELMEAQAEQMGLNPDKFPDQGNGGMMGGMGGMGGGQGTR